MNRKLQHTMQALAASAAVLSLMLIAGGPAPITAPAAGPAALLVASAGMAGSAVEALDAEAEPAAEADAPAGARRHRRGHATTALPYFSFAQGLRQVAGG
jgi:hypothetical protein